MRGRRTEQPGVTVSGRPRDEFGTNHRTATGAIFNHDLLPQISGQALGDHARHEVSTTAGRNRHNKADRPRWIILRLRASHQRCQ